MIAKIAMRDLIWSDVPLRAVCMLVSLNALNNFICIVSMFIMCVCTIFLDRMPGNATIDQRPTWLRMSGHGCRPSCVLFVCLVGCLFVCLSGLVA